MASGTADLQRDLGGAIMTSIFGALLTAGYSSAMGTAIDDSGKNITESTQAQLQLSFAGAESVAQENPQFSDQIISAAQEAFVDGDHWAYLAAMVAVFFGALLVYFFFPNKEDEESMRASFAKQDAAATVKPIGGEADRD
jgi:trans-aconitate methyltransferase